MHASSPPSRSGVPRWIWIVGVAAYLPVLVVLVLLALQLENTRTTVDGRLATAVTELRDATLPLADQVTPAAREANADRPAAKRLTRRSLVLERAATPLLRAATPLVSGLRAADAGTQLRAAGALATDLTARGAGAQLQKAGALSTNLLSVDAGRQIQRSGHLATTLLGADVGGTLTDVRGLASLLGDAHLPATTRSLSKVTDELGRGTRLERLLVRLTAAFGQITTLDTVPKVTAASDAVTARLLPLVERGVAMLAETLAITRETGRHTANLDRKLGGDLPLLP